MSGVSKLTADRNLRILLELVSKPGNDTCADCKARAPRWASYNLGIFICMNCASIHRKIGTHVTKVKSVTMDSWSREQVEAMKTIGNIMSNAKFNPNESRHPPPANLEESERDSELEKFIRWKYEFRRFMDKPRHDASTTVMVPPTRSQSTPAVTMARRSSPLPPVPTSPISKANVTSRAPETSHNPQSTTAHPLPHPQPSVTLPAMPLASLSTPPVTAQPTPSPVSKHPVWDDMMSLATNSQPVSQVPPQPQLQMPQQFQQPSFASPGSSANPFGGATMTNPFPSTMIDFNGSHSVGIAPPTNVGNPFQMQNMQPQPMMSNPFTPNPSGYAPPAPVQVQPGFGQPSTSPFAHVYPVPPPMPNQQQQQQQQQAQLVQSLSLPQQFVQSPHTTVQSGGPFGAPMQWPQQPPGFSGQPPYGQWGPS